MDILSARTWVIFYLICFVAMLWAVFLLAQGSMLVISLFLVVVVVGFNCILILAEVKRHVQRKETVSGLTTEKKL
jgi:hypothetical protein